MAFQNTNPFYGSANNSMSASSNQQRLALDNLIRRELKVGDPNDPKQIAEALLNRFKDDPRANAIMQEAKGLPFLQTGSVTVTQPASTSSVNELKQAMDDIDCDLAELTTNSLLKDVTPELQGWADAIRGTLSEGINAARFALDPRQRDKVFGIRRNLQDYARAARLVGAVTPALNQTYRSFAKSLDEAASVLLVMMGEALAEAGFNGGRYLLSVPYTELQVRRDTVISALRGLVGSSYITYGQEDFPYGLHGYRELLDYLETHGQGDLRTLLVENELSRSMDMLIQRAAHGTPEGLRALGATAAIELRRYRRMLRAAKAAVINPLSPPLTAYLKALQLFIDAFSAGGGYRLISIARPSVLLYGLYDVATSSDTDVLNDLVRQRGRLAAKLDCFLNCECSSAEVVYQVIFDKLLYDTDRAIDLYAMSSDESDEAEIRAMSYGYLIDYVYSTVTPPSTYSGISLGSSTYKPKDTESLADIKNVLVELRKSLLRNYINSSGVVKYLDVNSQQDLIDICDRELCTQYEAEESLKELVATLAPKCNLKLTENSGGFFGEQGLNATLVQKARSQLRTTKPSNLKLCEEVVVSMPPTSKESHDKRAKLHKVQNVFSAASTRLEAVKTRIISSQHAPTNFLGELIDVAKNTEARADDAMLVSDDIIIHPDYLFNFVHPKLQFNTGLTTDTTAKVSQTYSSDELKMIEISRLVKQILDVAVNDVSDERTAAIQAFQQFMNNNAELINKLNLGDNFEKIKEAFNNIPLEKDKDVRMKSRMSLKERCIDLVSVIGLGIKR